MITLDRHGRRRSDPSSARDWMIGLVTVVSLALIGGMVAYTASSDGGLSSDVPATGSDELRSVPLTERLGQLPAADWSTSRWSVWATAWWLVLVVPVLGPLSCLAMILAALQDKPPFIEARRAPGSMACGIAVVVSGVVFGTTLLVELIAWPSRNAGASVAGLIDAGLAATALAGIAVGLGLAAVHGNPVYRPRRSWIDRFGRVLALAWVLMVFPAVFLLAGRWF